MSTPLRIVHLSTYDVVGGAARASYRLHQGLREIGIASEMLVAHKRGSDSFVHLPRFPSRLDHRLFRRLRREWIAQEERRVMCALRPGLEFFSTARSAHHTLALHEAVQAADVLNLHWVAGLVDHSYFFAQLPKGKPLVWTLHDMAPFTGGCHYAGDCLKFTARCGACPQLGSSRETDAARRTFDIKSSGIGLLDPDRTVIVAPSTWVADQAARSALMGRFRIEHIPYGLDLGVFRPRGRALRLALGIEDCARTILFVSDHVLNPRKGIDLLRTAIQSMGKRDDIVLVSVGGGAPLAIDGVRNIHLGRIEADELLAAIYSMADVFVIPSREEQFGQTASEAASCGCPVVGFSVGGIPDIVEPGRTGFLAKPFDIGELRDCIETAITHREALSPASRARAERLFGLEQQARAYERLYLELQGAEAPSRSEPRAVSTTGILAYRDHPR